MRIYLLMLISLFIGSCTLKPVETAYHEDKDLTRFTTKPLKLVKKSREIKIFAEKECPGKVICSDNEIKLIVKHSERFAFLKGKDLLIETEKEQIDLNQRDYSNHYDMNEIAKDGTDGVLNEKYIIWISESDFLKAAHAEQATMNIGSDAFELPEEGRQYLQIMMDKGRLLEIMDKEQQREYGKYPPQKKEKKELDLRQQRMVSEAEESTWKLIKDSNNPEDIRFFLDKFPESPYAIPAKLRLKQLEREEQ